ncbi:MAG TPA: hypothetical protein VFQ74_06220 [Pseudolysinimonas sp.]|nr:hypothetical protein [Pseudolysinimonas sp.]
MARHRLRAHGIAAMVLALGAAALLAAPATAATPTIPDQPFTGTSAPSADWVTSGLNATPCLTAASVSAAGSLPACPGGPLDAAGDGALRLTDAAVQGGFALLATPFDTTQGIRIAFDFFQYDSTSPGDGMAFFLVDGAASPTQGGAYGGGMGYASYTGGGVPGVVGGYLGVAFDTYGAFADQYIGSGGLTTDVGNSISVRGDETQGYPLVSSHVASGALAVPTATQRDAARRHVVVTISKLNIMSVDVDYGSGLVPEISGLDLSTVNAPDPMPSTFKLGFTGSTGGAYLTTEIRNFEIQPLSPDLGITLSAGAVDPSTRDAVLTADVADSATAGPTKGIIRVTSTLPGGIVPGTATGSGWSCATVGQLVTCTRPGAGADSLTAGKSAPPISIPVHVGSRVSLPATVTASVAVLDDSSAANDSGSAQLLAPILAATGIDMPAWPVVLAMLSVALGAGLLLRRRLS